MKFIHCIKDGQCLLGIANDSADVESSGFFPIAKLLPEHIFADMIDLIQTISNEELATLREQLAAAPAGEAIPFSSVQLLSPIQRPIHDVLCVGLNYRAHAEEFERTDLAKNTATTYFSKRATHIIGSGAAIQGRFDLDSQLDYEVELAVIIGREGRDIPAEQAEDYIFGYSVFNDISSRQIQTQCSQWFRGKSLDTYTAMGPWIVHKSALPLPLSLNVQTTVDGELRQQSNTADMLCTVPQIIAELSAGMTLEPGDIIATGTPSGVAMGLDPSKYLRRGQKVICEIERIGQLENPIADSVLDK